MMNKYGDLEKAIAGQKQGLQDETETFIAGEKLSPGDAAFALVGGDDVAYKAHVNGVKLTASAALAAGNVVTVTINGNGIAPVSYQDSVRNTFQKIVDAINLNDEIRELEISAFLLEGEDNSFRLGGPGITITAAAVVTGGTAQPTFTAAASTSAIFAGVIRHMELSYKEGTGFYPQGSAVNVMTRGKIVVPVAPGSAPDNFKPAYVILAGDDAGLFTDVAAGNYDTGCVFRTPRIEGDLALVEVRGSK
jgi:hypothetical protein